MKDKLSTEELLFELKRAFDTAIDCGLPEDMPDVKQAYEQVKKLINDQWGAEQYYLDTINDLQKQLDEVKNERKSL